MDRPFFDRWSTVLDHTGTIVASYVSRELPLAVRILNPAHSIDGSPLKWVDIAPNSFRPTSTIQWCDIRAEALSNDATVTEPLTGSIDRSIVDALARIIIAPTDLVAIAQWQGYADADQFQPIRLVTMPPGREFHVYSARFDEIIAHPRLPMHWYDPRGSWMIGNDIYARSVFLSAGPSIIDALMSDPGIEIFSVLHSDPVLPEDR